MKRLFWSDNWWIEESKAWYVGGAVNALFEVDMISSKCRLLSILPVKELYDFRLYPRCLKFLEKIFCLPDRGNNILIYNLLNHEWTEILVNNPDNVRIGIRSFWIEEEKLWCVATGLKQIIRIDLKTESIEEIGNIDTEPETELLGSIMVGNEIYITDRMGPRIYIYEKAIAKTENFELQNINDKLLTISYDGEKFWMTGHKKAIYIWDKRNNRISVLDRFPTKFGSYYIDGKEKNEWRNKEDIFLSNIAIDKNIYFISKLANQILYINKSTFKMDVIEIENESESPEDTKAHPLSHKYLFQYVRENRFVGIFSLKYQQILEIDTYDKKEMYKKFLLAKGTKRILEEKRLLLYINSVCTKSNNITNIREEDCFAGGKKIYLALKNSDF